MQSSTIPERRGRGADTGGRVRALLEADEGRTAGDEEVASMKSFWNSESCRAAG